MKITIEKLALQTLLHAMLSCRCPVTEDTERALFQAYFDLNDDELVDFNPIFEVADVNPEPTPVHLLRDFSVYLQDSPAEFTITHNDVLRYFSTTYHLNRMRNHLNPLVVRYPAAFMVSHQLVPVLVDENGREPEAVFTFNNSEVRFHNIFVSPELELKAGVYYGLHLGTVITSLTEKQAEMMERHLNLFDEFPFLAKNVTSVDFCDCEHYGDYRAEVASRYKRHFSL